MDQYFSLIKNPPWDFALILTLAAGAFFWGASNGKKALDFIIVNMYIMLALWPFVPLSLLTDGRDNLELWSFKAGVFTLLLILLLLFMSRTFSWTGKEGVWWEILILALLVSGFFLSIILSFAPANKDFLYLHPLILQFFADPEFARWWSIFPILGVLFI